MIKNIINLNKVKFDSSLPNESIIVTYHDDGSPLSYFKDDIWDFKDSISSYTQTSIIDFNVEDKLNETSKYYIKLCLYFYIYHSDRSSISLSFKTIIGKFRMIRRLALICESNKLEFSKIKNNKFFINCIIDSISLDSKANIGKYLTVFELMNDTGYFYNLESFGFNEDSLKKVNAIRDIAIDDVNQTILIPSKIISEFIFRSSEFFGLFIEISAEIMQLIESEKFYIRSPGGNMRVPFNKLKFSEKLEEYFLKFEIDTRPKLISHFLYVQCLGSAFIACFSGMRKGELSSLSYNCLEKIENKELNNHIYILNGYTNKYTKMGLVSCNWVTSKASVEVIEILKNIANIHKILVDNGYISEEKNNISLDKYPLLPIFNQQKHKVGLHPLYDFPTLSTSLLSENIYKIIKPIIFEKTDLDELIDFNMLIDWELDYSLTVGDAWKFNYHQFRRSLAVYCSRSNIVKLPALKKQLKHISFDMTLYYSNNFHNAKNINFDEDFINLYNTEQELFKFSSFSKHVLDNESILFGASGTGYELLRKSENIPIYFTDRKQTLKYIKDGRLSYKKTPLGGCSRIGECNRLSFAYVTACVTCSDAVFDDNSVVALNKAKKNYQEQLLKLDKSSITYQQFQIEIDAIDKVLLKRNLLEVRNV
ncbi:hypothetical protein [Acinetobacter lwoffii]|uniref:hypothetical protein n=1 Tax=Acinetobacter lwoffii TaxID=28090 RepID=UPI0021CDB760|nr:hypothetical protein [Acinetobacter lwoffii]MCU4421064.1 hypothetical protein [Acinetobacter lwoffii]